MAIGARLRGILDELIATGFPDQVAERIASGDLPMDTASRMQRAEAMGFDPTDVQYHGTEADITSFIPSTSGKMGPGVYTTPSQSTANTFSGYPSPYAEGGNVMPLLTRGNYIDNADAFAMRPDISGKEGQRILNETLQEAGYAGRQAGGRGLLTGERVTFDPRNVRSLFAAFDPEYKGSNILGGAATAAVGAGLLAAPEEAEAGPVKTAKDLLFLHNTTADKLARQSAMGGMPNPSIAVTQQDVPFAGFGDISLVGKPEAFDPKLRSNPLYSADAYTVRAPSPVRVANKGAYKQFSSDFAPYRDAGNIDDVAYSLADLETKTRLEPSDFRRVNDFLEYDNAAALKFADDVGIKLSNKDYHEISQMKDKNADKYQEWKNGVLDQYFQGEEFFVTNPDFDRYAGRANLKPYTADNVSRYMTRQAGANKESTMTFGAGNIRASTAERIPSLPKAREMKGLLQPADAVAEVKETASMMLGDLQTALRDYYKYDTSSFRYFDEVGEMIALSERKGMKRAMEEIGFENVPDSLVKEIEEYKDYLRSAPTEYFESKPQRAVQLTDFAGAIVPENTSQGVLDMLSRAGLKVEKYGDEATRTEARKKFQDYMFDAAPTIGGGVGLGLLGMPQESVAETAARVRAESDTSGAYAPRSGLLQDVTMAARDLERRLEGSPASLLFPSGYVQHLEEFNRPYERSTYTGALLGALDFL